MARVERFGERRQYPRGERLFAAVDRTPGMFVVLKGALTMTAPDGLGRMAQAVRHGPGQLTDEVVQLSTGVAVVDADADDDLEALLIPPDRLHALILRRVAHIESGGSGPMLIGDPQSPDMLRLENFLRRNGQAHHAVDPSQDKAAALLLRRGRPGCTGRVPAWAGCAILRATQSFQSLNLIFLQLEKSADSAVITRYTYV
jgi:thioredoxin reductase (NADPH)